MAPPRDQAPRCSRSWGGGREYPRCEFFSSRVRTRARDQAPFPRPERLPLSLRAHARTREADARTREAATGREGNPHPSRRSPGRPLARRSTVPVIRLCLCHRRCCVGGKSDSAFAVEGAATSGHGPYLPQRPFDFWSTTGYLSRILSALRSMRSSSFLDKLPAFCA